jgi:hypothetical protein
MIGRRGPGDGPLSFTAACAMLVDAKPEFPWTCLISTNRSIPDSIRSIPAYSISKVWEKVPAPIRKIVEQHVAAKLPAEILPKLRDLHARGIPIGSDPAFFHFGGGRFRGRRSRRRSRTTSQ